MKRQWIVDKQESGLTIGEFACLHQINRKALKDIKMRGDILVDNEHQTVRYVLKAGEVVTFISPSEDRQITGENMPLTIVYEDDWLLIVDKEKGMPCIPTRHYQSGTLAHALSYYYEQIHLDSTIHLVNRLDRQTAGLMMIAKYREIHDIMSKQVDHIYRRYQANVEGELIGKGTIRLPIYRENKAMRRVIDERGKPSCTHYRSIEVKGNQSLVEFVLETGRTHQIRVHMAAVHHPLIGDELYGNASDDFDLTSIMVAFIHPVTKQIITIRKKKGQQQR